MNNQVDIWKRILMLTDGLNRRVKEPGWSYDDKQEVYSIKDCVLTKIMNKKPKKLMVAYYYVPYYSYSMKSKDKAGALMRSDTEQNPFEYYLSLVEPCDEDTEIPSKATVEVVIKCEDFCFNFHQPMSWYFQQGGNMDKLERKPWISSINFHHSQLEEQHKIIDELLSALQQ